MRLHAVAQPCRGQWGSVWYIHLPTLRSWIRGTARCVVPLWFGWCVTRLDDPVGCGWPAAVAWTFACIGGIFVRAQDVNVIVLAGSARHEQHAFRVPHVAQVVVSCRVCRTLEELYECVKGGSCARFKAPAAAERFVDDGAAPVTTPWHRVGRKHVTVPAPDFTATPVWRTHAAIKHSGQTKARPDKKDVCTREAVGGDRRFL